MQGRRTADRVAAGFLLLVMVIGSFALWIGVPMAMLYGLGRVATSKTNHYLLALLTVPVAMIMFATLLAWVNTLYLRATEHRFALPVDDDLRRPRGPLPTILSTSLVIALLAGIAWLLFGGFHPEGGTVW
jgi:hypothetical protein